MVAMHSMRGIFLGVGMSIGALPALAADDMPLSVKPGLWELTIDANYGKAKDITPEELAEMTLELTPLDRTLGGLRVGFDVLPR